MNRSSIIVAVLILNSVALVAQPSPPDRDEEQCPRDYRPFALRVSDLSSRLEGEPIVRRESVRDLPPSPPPVPYRSPLLAGLFSVVLPGAGEIYAESYLKAALFLVAEGAFWYVNITNNNMGDDQTVLFQDFANGHWNVVRYAEWLNRFASTFKGGDRAVTIRIDPDESLPPWVRVSWEDMNQTESVITEFSHRLPPYGDQQYYELIGKYQQYNHGWDDSDPNTAVYYTNLSPRFHEYSTMRGKANDYYNTASTFAALIIVNHVLSALDAAWSAAQFNARYSFSSRFEMRPTLTGYELVPTARLAVRF